MHAPRWLCYFVVWRAVFYVWMRRAEVFAQAYESKPREAMVEMFSVGFIAVFTRIAAGSLV